MALPSAEELEAIKKKYRGEAKDQGPQVPAGPVAKPPMAPDLAPPPSPSGNGEQAASGQGPSDAYRFAPLTDTPSGFPYLDMKPPATPDLSPTWENEAGLPPVPVPPAHGFGDAKQADYLIGEADKYKKQYDAIQQKIDAFFVETAGAIPIERQREYDLLLTEAASAKLLWQGYNAERYGRMATSDAAIGQYKDAANRVLEFARATGTEETIPPGFREQVDLHLTEMGRRRYQLGVDLENMGRTLGVGKLDYSLLGVDDIGRNSLDITAISDKLFYQARDKRTEAEGYSSYGMMGKEYAKKLGLASEEDLSDEQKKYLDSIKKAILDQAGKDAQDTIIRAAQYGRNVVMYDANPARTSLDIAALPPGLRTIAGILSPAEAISYTPNNEQFRSGIYGGAFWRVLGSLSAGIAANIEASAKSRAVDAGSEFFRNPSVDTYWEATKLTWGFWLGTDVTEDEALLYVQALRKNPFLGETSGKVWMELAEASDQSEGVVWAAAAFGGLLGLVADFHIPDPVTAVLAGVGAAAHVASSVQESRSFSAVAKAADSMEYPSFMAFVRKTNPALEPLIEAEIAVDTGVDALTKDRLRGLQNTISVVTDQIAAFRKDRAKEVAAAEATLRQVRENESAADFLKRSEEMRTMTADQADRARYAEAVLAQKLAYAELEHAKYSQAIFQNKLKALKSEKSVTGQILIKLVDQYTTAESGTKKAAEVIQTLDQAMVGRVSAALSAEELALTAAKAAQRALVETDAIYKSTYASQRDRTLGLLRLLKKAKAGEALDAAELAAVGLKEGITAEKLEEVTAGAVAAFKTLEKSFNLEGARALANSTKEDLKLARDAAKQAKKEAGADTLLQMLADQKLYQAKMDAAKAGLVSAGLPTNAHPSTFDLKMAATNLEKLISQGEKAVSLLTEQAKAIDLLAGGSQARKAAAKGLYELVVDLADDKFLVDQWRDTTKNLIERLVNGKKLAQRAAAQSRAQVFEDILKDSLYSETAKAAKVAEKTTEAVAAAKQDQDVAEALKKVISESKTTLKDPMPQKTKGKGGTLYAVDPEMRDLQQRQRRGSVRIREGGIESDVDRGIVRADPGWEWAKDKNGKLLLDEDGNAYQVEIIPKHTVDQAYAERAKPAWERTFVPDEEFPLHRIPGAYRLILESMADAVPDWQIFHDTIWNSNHPATTLRELLYLETDPAGNVNLLSLEGETIQRRLIGYFEESEIVDLPVENLDELITARATEIRRLQELLFDEVQQLPGSAELALWPVDAIKQFLYYQRHTTSQAAFVNRLPSTSFWDGAKYTDFVDGLSRVIKEYVSAAVPGSIIRVDPVAGVGTKGSFTTTERFANLVPYFTFRADSPETLVDTIWHEITHYLLQLRDAGPYISQEEHEATVVKSFLERKNEYGTLLRAMADNAGLRVVIPEDLIASGWTVEKALEDLMICEQLGLHDEVPITMHEFVAYSVGPLLKDKHHEEVLAKVSPSVARWLKKLAEDIVKAVGSVVGKIEDYVKSLRPPAESTRKATKAEQELAKRQALLDEQHAAFLKRMQEYLSEIYLSNPVERPGLRELNPQLWEVAEEVGYSSPKGTLYAIDKAKLEQVKDAAVWFRSLTATPEEAKYASGHLLPIRGEGVFGKENPASLQEIMASQPAWSLEEMEKLATPPTVGRHPWIDNLSSSLRTALNRSGLDLESGLFARNVEENQAFRASILALMSRSFDEEKGFMWINEADVALLMKDQVLDLVSAEQLVPSGMSTFRIDKDSAVFGRLLEKAGPGASPEDLLHAFIRYISDFFVSGVGMNRGDGPITIVSELPDGARGMVYNGEVTQYADGSHLMYLAAPRTYEELLEAMATLWHEKGHVTTLLEVTRSTEIGPPILNKDFFMAREVKPVLTSKQEALWDELIECLTHRDTENFAFRNVQEALWEGGLMPVLTIRHEAKEDTMELLSSIAGAALEWRNSLGRTDWRNSFGDAEKLDHPPLPERFARWQGEAGMFHFAPLLPDGTIPFFTGAENPSFFLRDEFGHFEYLYHVPDGPEDFLTRTHNARVGGQSPHPHIPQQTDEVTKSLAEAQQNKSKIRRYMKTVTDWVERRYSRLSDQYQKLEEAAGQWTDARVKQAASDVIKAAEDSAKVEPDRVLLTRFQASIQRRAKAVVEDYEKVSSDNGAVRDFWVDGDKLFRSLDRKYGTAAVRYLIDHTPMTDVSRLAKSLIEKGGRHKLSADEVTALQQWLPGLMERIKLSASEDAGDLILYYNYRLIKENDPNYAVGVRELGPENAQRSTVAFLSALRRAFDPFQSATGHAGSESVRMAVASAKNVSAQIDDELLTLVRHATYKTVDPIIFDKVCAVLGMERGYYGKLGEILAAHSQLFMSEPDRRLVQLASLVGYMDDTRALKYAGGETFLNATSGGTLWQKARKQLLSDPRNLVLSKALTRAEIEAIEAQGGVSPAFAALARCWTPAGGTLRLSDDRLRNLAKTAYKLLADNEKAGGTFLDFMVALKKATSSPMLFEGTEVGITRAFGFAARAAGHAVTLGIAGDIYVRGVEGLVEAGADAESVAKFLAGNYSELDRSSYAAVQRFFMAIGSPQSQTASAVADARGAHHTMPLRLMEISRDQSGKGVFLYNTVVADIEKLLPPIIKEPTPFHDETRSLETIFGRDPTGAFTHAFKSAVVTGTVFSPEARYWVNNVAGDFSQMWFSIEGTTAVKQSFQNLPANVPLIGPALQDWGSRMARWAQGKPVLGSLTGALFNPHLSAVWNGGSGDVIFRSGQVVSYDTLRLWLVEDGILDTFVHEELAAAFSRVTPTWALRLWQDFADSIPQYANFVQQRQRSGLYIELLMQGKSRAEARRLTLAALYDWRNGVSEAELAFFGRWTLFYRFYRMAMTEMVKAFYEPLVRPKEAFYAALQAKTPLARLRNQYAFFEKGGKEIPWYVADALSAFDPADTEQEKVERQRRRDRIQQARYISPSYLEPRPGQVPFLLPDEYSRHFQRTRGRWLTEGMISLPKMTALEMPGLMVLPVVFFQGLTEEIRAELSGDVPRTSPGWSKLIWGPIIDMMPPNLREPMMAFADAYADPGSAGKPKSVTLTPAEVAVMKAVPMMPTPEQDPETGTYRTDAMFATAFRMLSSMAGNFPGNADRIALDNPGYQAAQARQKKANELLALAAVETDPQKKAELDARATALMLSSKMDRKDALWWFMLRWFGVMSQPYSIEDELRRRGKGTTNILKGQEQGTETPFQGLEPSRSTDYPKEKP